MNDLVVKTGEYRVTEGPMVIQSYGIGSCVVVLLYDADRQIGGLAHCMLPSRRQNTVGQSPRYIDDAVAMLLEAMMQKGARKKNITARLVGGANMFASQAVIDQSIGQANILAAREALKHLGIPILSEDVGGTAGRSVAFHLSNGDCLITKTM